MTHALRRRSRAPGPSSIGAAGDRHRRARRTGVRPRRHDWTGVAQCESSGNWSINTGNGYYGGLQFSQSTWAAYGGTRLRPARRPRVRRAQQIAIAEKVLAGQGAGAWPTCGRQLAGGSTAVAAAPAPSLRTGRAGGRHRRRPRRPRGRRTYTVQPGDTLREDRPAHGVARRLAGRCGRGTRARSANPNLHPRRSNTCSSDRRSARGRPGARPAVPAVRHRTHGLAGRGLADARTGMIDAVPVTVPLEAPACPLPPSSPSGRPLPERVRIQVDGAVARHDPRTTAAGGGPRSRRPRRPTTASCSTTTRPRGRTRGRRRQPDGRARPLPPLRPGGLRVGRRRLDRPPAGRRRRLRAARRHVHPRGHARRRDRPARPPRAARRRLRRAAAGQRASTARTTGATTASSGTRSRRSTAARPPTSGSSTPATSRASA